MYGGLPMTVVPWAAISRKREVPKSLTLSMPGSDSSMLPGRRSRCRMPDAMRVIDRVAHLTGEVERLRQLERALACDALLERLARHVLHHDEEVVVLLLGRQDRDDVRVTHRREQARLLHASR